MDPSEGQLAEQARLGDEAALTGLLRRFGPVVRSRIEPTISANLRSIIDADDVMQVTYLEAFLRINAFQPRGEGSFLAWLSRIAENNLRDAVESMQRLKRPPAERRLVSSEQSSVDLIEKIGFTTTTPSRHAVARELHQAVGAAVDGLPEAYARVVRMYDLEGHSADEVARSIGRTEGAVYMLRARALDRLRETFSSVPGVVMKPA